jgi:hypothetical protein
MIDTPSTAAANIAAHIKHVEVFELHSAAHVDEQSQCSQVGTFSRDFLKPESGTMQDTQIS